MPPKRTFWLKNAILGGLGGAKCTEISLFFGQKKCPEGEYTPSFPCALTVPTGGIIKPLKKTGFFGKFRKIRLGEPPETPGTLPEDPPEPRETPREPPETPRNPPGGPPWEPPETPQEPPEPRFCGALPGFCGGEERPEGVGARPKTGKKDAE